ncbi:hypothetical protein FOXG_11882 [Fusarium oxysporum f. sp. lycopersici 4287]|uniref:YCII-related domain-containing protein n=2 Tax=Fusarium oxysporum TaxID=5507 RepID=A0A0J9VNM7_FUSO4|nr:hypothetical protein FOXG_11882 [Fusarium oxysporum f. sp. lycopersici 4287]EXK29545.1 hypothetical protein FOMG_14018 [Fusarium oxysporum f. sp. melonis 26406]KAJ9418940.1 hypothetical protein QL093DRAFT_2016496 [Fusarium oxysporum]KNB12255.1 hypothetical protein FOXG_11882 [Fusarium oxysporum f. sp. lycopersici 4287]
MATKYDWIVLIPDHKGALAKRIAARPDHLKGIASRIESGVWIMGGPTLDYPPIDGQEKAINGSCIVANAPSREEVMEEIRKDIYATSGVWNLEKITILPLMTAFRKGLPGSTY